MKVVHCSYFQTDVVYIHPHIDVRGGRNSQKVLKGLQYQNFPLSIITKKDSEAEFKSFNSTNTSYPHHKTNHYYLQACGREEKGIQGLS